jgi:hypothetical protein
MTSHIWTAIRSFWPPLTALTTHPLMPLDRLGIPFFAGPSIGNCCKFHLHFPLTIFHVSLPGEVIIGLPEDVRWNFGRANSPRSTGTSSGAVLAERSVSKSTNPPRYGMSCPFIGISRDRERITAMVALVQKNSSPGVQSPTRDYCPTPAQVIDQRNPGKCWSTRLGELRCSG